MCQSHAVRLPGLLVLWANRLACSLVCIGWRTDSLGLLEVHHSQKQVWAKADLFLKYLLTLKNNSSQLMLQDHCSPFLFLSVPTPPCTSNCFSTTGIILKILFITVQSNFSQRELASWLVWGFIAKHICFISGKQMKMAWCLTSPQLEENLCSGNGLWTCCGRGEDFCQSPITYPAGCAKTKM